MAAFIATCGFTCWIRCTFRLPLYSFLQTAGPYVYATEISAESRPGERGSARWKTAGSTGEKVELVAQVLDRNGLSRAHHAT